VHLSMSVVTSRHQGAVRADEVRNPREDLVGSDRDDGGKPIQGSLAHGPTDGIVGIGDAALGTRDAKNSILDAAA